MGRNTLNEQQALNVALGYGGSDLIASDDVLLHHAGQSGTSGVVEATLEGDLDTTQVLSTGHGLSGGEFVELRLTGEAPGFGTIFEATLVDDDNFTVEVSWSGVSQTGIWELAENATDKWYPGVDRWVVVKAIAELLTFGDGCQVDTPPMARPPDPPADGEVVAADQYWQEGPLTVFVRQAGDGSVRLLRG